MRVSTMLVGRAMPAAVRFEVTRSLVEPATGRAGYEIRLTGEATALRRAVAIDCTVRHACSHKVVRRGRMAVLVVVEAPLEPGEVDLSVMWDDGSISLQELSPTALA